MADSDEHRDRGLFHLHKKSKDPAVLVETTEVHETATIVDGKKQDAKVDIKKHAHLEHLAEAGVVLGGVMAKHEKHQAKKHPEEAHKHHVGEAIAGAIVAGSGTYAALEHHDKKEAKKEAKNEAKHHHLF